MGVSDEELNARFDQIARKIDSLAHVFASALLDTRQALENRIDAVEGKLDAFRDETHWNFDGAYQRLDRVESENGAIKAALQRVEKRFSEDA